MLWIIEPATLFNKTGYSNKENHLKINLIFALFYAFAFGDCVRDSNVLVMTITLFTVSPNILSWAVTVIFNTFCVISQIRIACPSILT